MSQLNIRYFASLREALGPQAQWPHTEGLTVGGLRQALAAQDSAHAEALAAGRAVRCALNHVLVDESAVVPAGAEVAFFPPVTGG
ncbi:MoaD/ThiS family protein [Roseateles sp. BYS180W]|uniref:MoaD/ThiS family protein n=1 Tax=Roseateles rivi TaxID=3299028 RepID=A0ABW7FSR3_9BURK